MIHRAEHFLFNIFILRNGSALYIFLNPPFPPNIRIFFLCCRLLVLSNSGAVSESWCACRHLYPVRAPLLESVTHLVEVKMAIHYTCNYCINFVCDRVCTVCTTLTLRAMAKHLMTLRERFHNFAFSVLTFRSNNVITCHLNSFLICDFCIKSKLSAR